ncbi:MAG: 4-hydroxythreonine-4-phosphate dehydrogenase PdxA [Alphaproteobacteria bacterium]
MKPIAVSMGEPAGIGPEIILAAWRARKEQNLPPFFVCGDPIFLRHFAQQMAVPVLWGNSDEDAAAGFEKSLPVYGGHGLASDVIAGKPDTGNAHAIIGAIDDGVRCCLEGFASALVTVPIQKSTLYDAGFKYPGHTEYLEAKFAGEKIAPESLMLLVGGGLKVALVTIHVPLKEVAPLITQTAIVRKGQILAKGLAQDFGIARPRIAVAALNPHGGEDGALGREEIDIIAPAVRALASKGIDARGPFPADTLFHEQARKNYDAVLCMYHDQALIPLKTLDFFGGVNVTLGLPIVRTSPDHGTALDIAGKGLANPQSFINALKLAAEIAERREQSTSPPSGRG